MSQTMESRNSFFILNLGEIQQIPKSTLSSALSRKPSLRHCGRPSLRQQVSAVADQRAAGDQHQEYQQLPHGDHVQHRLHGGQGISSETHLSLSNSSHP